MNELSVADLPEQIQSEVQQYLGMPVSEFGVAARFTSNPLDFWESHKTRLPLLAACANRFLCLPASSAEVERVASTGRRVGTPHWTGLKPQNASMLIFLSHNHVYLVPKKE